jgi:hypothetical protein
MVEISRRTAGIVRKVELLHRDPPFKPGVSYIQSFADRKPVGYRKERWTTLTLDLTEDPDALLSGMNKTTRTHIRQVEKMEPSFRVVESPDEFLVFFNDFAATKQNVTPRRWGDLEEYQETLVITALSLEGVDVSMHSYFFDPEESWARLLLSASIRLSETLPFNPNIVGKCSRYHHWADIRYFAETGAKTYDFGGYAKDSQDRDKANIATFKAGFGGTEELFFHYTPWTVVVLSSFKQIVRKAVTDIRNLFRLS